MYLRLPVHHFIPCGSSSYGPPPHRALAALDHCVNPTAENARRNVRTYARLWQVSCAFRFGNSDLVLRSSNTIIKETPVMPGRLERPAPDPWLGAGIELVRCDAGRLYKLGRISKALSGERLAPQESPPAFLQVEPARSGGDE